MEFKNDHLLSFKELKKMLKSDLPNEKASIMQSKLQYYMYMDEMDRLYALQTNITCKKCPKCDDTLKTFATLLIEKSFTALEQDKKDDLKENQAAFRDLCSNANVDRYLPQLKILLRSDEEFDKYYDVIHFNNGYFNLRTGEFHKRVMGKHFITVCIKYDYKLSTKNKEAN